MRLNLEQNGAVINTHASVDSYNSLMCIVYNSIEKATIDITGKKIVSLEKFHETVPLSEVNNIRMSAYSLINSHANLHQLLFQLASDSIISILGPDIAVQKKVNLSIVPPQDQSSIIEFHSDINTGESLYELVSWVPFTRCFSTNSIFITDLKRSLELHKSLKKYNSINSKPLRESAEESMNKIFLDISTQQNLLFSPIIYHGSSTNTTESTRVSLNYRLKNLYTPYTHHPCYGKDLNEFFTEFRLSDLSKIVNKYTPPDF